MPGFTAAQTKTASGLAVSSGRMLFASAPPDRLGRGIKAAQVKAGSQVHARQSIKSGLFTPTALK
jgi:hypothetical protein